MRGLPEERDEAERFASDVDALQAGRPVLDSSDDAQKADLELARLLYQARFAPSRGFEFRLRNQLLDRLDRKEAKQMSLSRLFRKVARPVLVATLSAVLLFGMVMVVSPDVRAAAGGWVARFVEVDSPSALFAQRSLPAPGAPARPDARLRPEGPSEEILPLPSPELVVPDKSTESLPQAASAGTGTQQTQEAAPKQSRESLPRPAPAEDEVSPSADLVSLETAQEGVSFKIRMPSQLPDGYKFLGAVPPPSLSAAEGLAMALPADLPKPPAVLSPEEVQRRLPADAPKLPADALKLEPPQTVMLIFGNSGGDKLMLSELRGPTLERREAPLPAGKGSIKEVTINGQPAQYIEGEWTEKGWVATGNHQLHWQDAEGVLYDLMSLNLGFEELLAVAESIK